MKSTQAVILVAIIWFLLGAFYYPKWKLSGSEATISWDVSGYYHYLPGAFIYHDLKHQDWMTYVNEKYLPSPAYDQTFFHEPSGNKVNKYAIGQAVLYSPFFFIGHIHALISDQYPADGYSRPYQQAIWLGSLFFAILGLILLRLILLRYFDETITFWIIIALGLATNYMEYASITNAMNHGWLFTLMCGLILSSITFYDKASWISAAGIGICLGLSILTRPTEIVWALIPLLWNIRSVSERIYFLKKHWKKCFLAIVLCGLIMSIQSIYWKYVAGEWIVYSYGEQGFNWLHPKIYKGLFGVKIGWWAYTPIMLIAMFGWRSLYKIHRSVFWPSLLVVLLAIYITTAWKHFIEGGGLGQRNLIQIYPLMAFPLGMGIAKILKWKNGTWIWLIILLLNIYYNMWWSHQAHRGGYFQATQMTTPYFLKVLGKWKLNRDYYKLLDTREYFDRTPLSKRYIYENDFNADSTNTKEIAPGNKAIRFDSAYQNFGPLVLNVNTECGDWIRLEADFTIQSHEWDVWKDAQWIVQFFQNEQVVKTNLIRVQRLIPQDQVATYIFFDVKLPKANFDRCAMSVWNGTSKEVIWMDNLRVSCFND